MISFVFHSASLVIEIGAIAVAAHWIYTHSSKQPDPIVIPVEIRNDHNH